MRKETKFSTEAREGLKRGIDELANAVKVTLGPQGMNVIIKDSFGDISTTKDGVTVAKNIEPIGELENIGANMMKEVASKTNELVADGTTTATVLAQAILTEVFSSIKPETNIRQLKQGIELAKNCVIDYLNISTIQIEDDFDKIRQVATISANNDRFIGDIITSAFEKVGMNGVVTVSESKTSETYLDYTQGMSFDRGCESPHFYTDKEKGIVEFQNPLIFVSDKKLNDFKSFIPLLESVLKAKRPLLVITDDVDNEFMSNFVMNKIQGGFEIALVKAPSYGERRKEMLKDIAVLTDTFVYSDNNGTNLEDRTYEMLGTCDKIIVDKNNTTIIGGSYDQNKLDSRIAYINNIIEQSNSEYDKTKARERLGKLTSGVCIINVGGTTELEAKERNYRVVDALGATKAAIEEGILPGGGIALINSISKIINTDVKNDVQLGIDIIKKVLEEPLKCILKNASIESSHVINNIKASTIDNYGYDANNMLFGDMIKLGIIDPKKVTRITLENAVSVANMILSIDCVIINKEEK